MSTQPGIAMLLVLAALVAGLSSAAIVAQIVTTGSLQNRQTADRALCRDLAAAADGPVLHWLRRHAGSVVLPPDVASPAVEVLDETLELPDGSRRLRITAWDQYGLPGWNASELHDSLPPAIVNALRQVPENSSPGLDLIATDAVYPRDLRDLQAAGAVLATHNPATPPTGPSPQRVTAVNLNTAPMSLVRRACALAGFEDTAAIAEARRNGKSASAGGRTGGPSTATLAIRLVTSSQAWAFRVEATVGTATEAWWCIYVHEKGGWRCAQRLIVTD